MSNYFSGIVVERASINLSTLSGTVWLLLLLPTMTRVSSLAPATSGRRVADAAAAVCEGGRAGGSGAGIGGSWPRPRRHVAAHYLLRLIELPNLRETTDGRRIRRRRRLSHGSNLPKIAGAARVGTSVSPWRLRAFHCAK